MPLAIFLLVVGAVLFYRIGELEYGSGFTTAGLSVGLGLLSWLLLDWGRFGYLGSQLFLFICLTWYTSKRYAKWGNRSS